MPDVDQHTPLPWTWRNVSGAGLQISAMLPAGFQFDGTARGADGKTSFMIWSLRETHSVQIADERWVQFATGSWSQMQEANGAFIVRACNSHHEMLSALRNVQKLISEAAMTGFNYRMGDWAERLFESQQVTSGAIAKATGGGKDG